ncbi:MAG TPA: transcription termination factor Rho [Bifidobacterium pseudolongum subsp. globosum]|uniref:Transcription termination factor Rho n=1 Tax=Bifidobacterium pseudolongum subsp. globosum TaxID=1690 RepID=A0A4Q5BB27_9BIFI|nr:transcription termination factor Rho [Bifidobacterium pseudolongum]RYQ66104.1 transcription termination factor Rho [Bifidobacterium pseudolongum subsp. globosum]HJE55825.1 transcription termination factor Rho [Bifidobacterium pseudolongum subsp. globosum]
MATTSNLDEMKLPELKELAKQLGLRGVSTMRKGDLIATLQAARSGGEAPAGVTVRAPKAESAAAQRTKKQEQPAPAAGERQPAPKAQAAAQEPAQDESPAPQSNMEMKVTARRVRKRRGAEVPATGRTDDEAASKAADDLLSTLDLHGDGQKQGRRNAEPRPRRGRHAADVDEQPRHRHAEPREVPQDLDEILDSLPVHKNADHESSNTRAEAPHRGRNRANNERNNNRRNKNRDNDKREEQPADLVPVAGIVDVLDSYAFIRTSGYLPGPNDVYVSMGQIKKYGLRKGDAVKGSIRTPHEGDRRNQRQKFVPLQSIDSINGMSVEEASRRPQFSKLTPLYPNERLRQETTPNRLTGRLIDIVAPIGKGQRGLIVSPPKAGKTITLQNIANAIATNNPEVYLMVVLVDERPEEVTDMERTVQGEVISSTFDRPASDHTTVAELAIERAKRLVELGQDVVVLLDSMTRLARAYNIAAPASGRILSGGVDAQALYPPKKFFGAARNIENGGSLTIISSALVETGSKMDEVIFEEFKGTGNMELRLSRELADKRMFPAVDINASGTRREELITDPQELPVIYRLRRLLGGLEPEQAYQTLVPRLKKTMTNHDFFGAILQQGGGAINGNTDH